MNCKQSRLAIALYVGNDLPEPEIARFRSHLDRCADCSRELQQYRNSRQGIAAILKEDITPPLPTSFTYLVLEKIRQTETVVKPSRLRTTYNPIYIGAAVTVVAIFFLLLINNIPFRGRQATLQAHLRGIAKMESQDLEFNWDSKLKYLDNLEGPIRLDEWQPSERSGIIAIMHKPDPLKRPKTYILDYCEDSRNIKAMLSYPWFNQRIERLSLVAGSQQNIFIAFYYLPHSTRLERNQIIKKIENKYKVNLFNRKEV